MQVKDKQFSYQKTRSNRADVRYEVARVRRLEQIFFGLRERELAAQRGILLGVGECDTTRTGVACRGLRRVIFRDLDSPTRNNVYIVLESRLDQEFVTSHVGGCARLLVGLVSRRELVEHLLRRDANSVRRRRSSSNELLDSDSDVVLEFLALALRSVVALGDMLG